MSTPWWYKRPECWECGTQGPHMPPEDRYHEFHRACHDLYWSLCEGLRVPQMVDWIARRIYPRVTGRQQYPTGDGPTFEDDMRDREASR